MHRGWHGDTRDGLHRIDTTQRIARVHTHLLPALRRDVARMVGVEHQLDALALVLAVQFRVPVVVTDEYTAAYALDGKDAEMASRTVVRQVVGGLGPVARAEHLVVAIHKFTSIVDDVETAVRFVRAGEAMRGPENDPYAAFTS